MLVPISSILGDVLAKATRAHFQHVVNKVGPVTDAELEGRLGEAAHIHAAEWNRTPHPLDSTLDQRLHDWAIRHIAANCVARARGYDVERDPRATPHESYRLREHYALTPAMRAGED